MGMKKYFWFALVIGFLLLIPAVSVQAITEADCGPGYTWDRMSGVGCKQTNCNDIGDAHYSYTGHCICGSSGSINEDPTDPNKECYKGSDNEGCSGCLYACVGLDEDCPGDTGTTTNTNSSNNTNTSVSTNPNTNQATNTNANQNTNTNSNQNVNISQAGTNISLNTGGTATGPTCESHCNKYLRGHKNAVLTSFSGTFPACKCQIDIKDDLNRLTNTISVDGDNDTTYTFDQNGNLTKKVKVNRKEETEKIRIRLGYKYTQEEIDKILDPDKIEEWFLNQIKNIKTEKLATYPIDGIFVYVGSDPNTGFLGQLVKLDKQKFIITDEEMRTSADGIFAAGDVRKKSLRQVSTAVGDGAIAAENARKYIEDLSLPKSKK